MIRIFDLLCIFILLFSTQTIYAGSPDPQESRYGDELVAQSRELHLSKESQWLNLVHYKKNFWGNEVSQAAGTAFFLAPDGKTSPSDELETTIRGFFAKDPEMGRKDSPQCQFPARFMWLDRKLHFDRSRLPFLKCERFDHFRDLVAARSATVIFASYFLNNPSSSFGHSFLRLNKSDSSLNGDHFELLDFGINYAADVDNTNPIIYAFKGIAGLFKGTFTSIPFYYKVREYNDFEARDLWNYDLNLTPDQMTMLVAHIWELGSTYFDYFYLSQNCSYHILSMLDTVNPDLKLTDHLPHFFVIPIETIKVLVNTPGLVKSIRYRPSVRAQLGTRLDSLSPGGMDALKKIVEKREDAAPDSLSVKEQAGVYDAAIDYVDFKNPKDILLGHDTPAAKWKQRLLVARSRLGITSDDLNIAVKPFEEPHLGHDSIRANLNYGTSDSGGRYSVVGWRFALHDLLDPQRGYPEYAQIEFVNTRLRYNYDQASLWIDELTLFGVISLSEWTSLDHQISWRFRTGIEILRDRGCTHCQAGVAKGGAGFTWKVVHSLPLSVFTLAEADIHYTPNFDFSPWRLGTGPTLGLRYRAGENFIVMLQGSYRFFVGRTGESFFYSLGATQALGDRWAINLVGSRYPDAWEASLGVSTYF